MKENGYRQYNTAYVEIPKKQGKSELAAAVALYLLAGDGEWGAEVPWGEGRVNAAAFLAALDKAGYAGAIAVEREGGTSRAADIALAVKRLRAS